MKGNKYIIALIWGVVVCSCSYPTPSPKAELPQAYNLAYEEIYGHYYDSTAAVVALDLYSEGLELDENHRIKGTGYNLYLSDIFVPDSLLVPGVYASDTTAQPFTFLPGRSYEGIPHGIYILTIEQDQVKSIQVVDSGSFVYRNDSLLFTLYYSNSNGTKTTYEAYYFGDLQLWPKQ